MSRPERQQNVLDLLKGLRGIEPLKQLFWSELNYQRVNQPLSRRGWIESASKALAHDPVLFAGGGEDNAFHVIYCRLASDKLLLGGERLVVSRLLNEHPYTLFVFSNTAQDHWHFLNVKYDEASDKRRLFRRITVGPEERLRTASERISLLSLESFGLAPLTIQQHHDEAFDVEMVTTLFYKKFAELFHELRSDIINSKPGLENEGRNATQDLMNRLLFLYFIQKKGWLDSNPFYLVERFGQTARKTPKATNYYSETLLPLFLALSAPDAPSAKLGKVPFLNGGLFELDLPTEAQLKISNAIFGRLFDELFEHYNFTVREDTPLDQEVAVDPEMLGKVFEELVLEQEQGKDARRGSGSYYTRRVVTHFKARDALRLYLLDESFWPAGTWDKKDLPIDLSGADSKHGSLESLAHRAARHTTRDRVDKYLRTRDPSHLDIPLARHLRDLLKKVKVCDLACGSGAYLVEMLHAIADLWRQLSDILNEKCLPEDKLRQQIISENLYGADIQKTAVKICELRLWLALVVDKELPPGEMPPPLPNLSYRIRVGDSLRSEFAGIIFSPHSLVLNDKTRKRVEQLNERRLQYFSINNEKRKHDLSTEVDKLELELFEAEIDDQIKRLKTFAALNPDDEEKIRQLQTARKDLRDPKKPKPFVWHIHFSEIFSDGRTGFDIMLANPPYGLKEENHPPADFGLQSKDSYGLFVVRALDLLREGGIFSFIMSDTWQTIKSHKPLRRRLLDSACVRHLLMMPAWIFGATVNTSILVLRKRADTSSAAARERRESVIVAADLTRVPKDELLLQVGFDSMHEPQSQRPCDEEMAFYEYPQELILTNSNLPFFVTSPKLFALMNDTTSPVKHERIGGKRVPVRTVQLNGHDVRLVKLGDVAEVKVGLQTGDNDSYLFQNPDARGSYRSIQDCRAFLLTDTDLERIRSDKNLRRAVVEHGISKDDKRSNCYFSGRYIVPYDKGGESDSDEGWMPNYYVPTNYFIDLSESAIRRMRTLTLREKNRLSGKKGGNDKLTSRFQNTEFYFQQGITFSYTGVYAPNFKASSGAVFDVGGSSCFDFGFATEELLPLLANKVVRHFAKACIDHTVNFQVDEFKEIPVVVTDLNRIAELAGLARVIIEKQQSNPRYDYATNEQLEIDRLIYEAYGLNKEDIREVETWYARRYPKLAAAARRKAAKA